MAEMIHSKLALKTVFCEAPGDGHDGSVINEDI